MPGPLPRLLLVYLPCLLALPLATGKDCCTWSVILPSPTHLAVTLKGIGFIKYTWAWKPPSDLENSTSLPVRYESWIKYDGAKWDGRKRNPSLTRAEVLLLNQGITFRVKAFVDPENCICGTSNYTRIYIPPDKGDADTAVTNFRCVYYNFEYINCTWDNGSKTPSDTVYDFHYWQDGMDVIQKCASYILKDGRAAGCHIQRDKFNNNSDLNTRVTGLSAHAMIKPFFLNMEKRSFVELCPPWGINISKTGDGLDIKWQTPVFWKQSCVDYELRMRSSMSSPWINRTYNEPAAKIPYVELEVKYTVQVRAKYRTLCGDNGIWSKWSAEEYFGEDKGQGWSLKVTLLIIIPILVAVAAVVLLTFLKKLQILILPPIPDPGKLFKGVFGDPNGNYSTSSKPDKGCLTFKLAEEITCKVTTVEKLECPAEKAGKLGENEVSEEDACIVCVDEEIPVDDDYMNYNLVTS